MNGTLARILQSLSYSETPEKHHMAVEGLRHWLHCGVRYEKCSPVVQKQITEALKAIRQYQNSLHEQQKFGRVPLSELSRQYDHIKSLCRALCEILLPNEVLVYDDRLGA